MDYKAIHEKIWEALVGVNPDFPSVTMWLQSGDGCGIPDTYDSLMIEIRLVTPEYARYLENLIKPSDSEG